MCFEPTCRPKFYISAYRNPVTTIIMNRSTAGRLIRAFHSTARARHGTAGSTSASEEEMKHFKQLAATWWDTNGPQRILHKMNLLRMDFMNENLKVLQQNTSQSAVKPAGVSLDILPDSDPRKTNAIQLTDKKRVLDIGCGGGILAEHMARLPWTSSVDGIDMSPDVLQVAVEHAKKDASLTKKLNYRRIALEDLPRDEKFDIVTMYEVLEHITYPAEFMKHALSKVNPGGWVFLSTINRTPISWFTTIFVAEHLMRLVPPGTHTYSKYINEEEIRDFFATQKDWEFVDSKGCMYVPGCGWVWTPNERMGNYMMAFRKKD
jgi:polyprenyldihydroxybenzoate methyltransferase/3-demethylubiquinol 3-O-methyltransferase